MNASLVWFRRDLRLDDHAALHAALAAGGPVHCAFVFDTDILAGLSERADRRVSFIHARVAELRAALAERGGGLHVLHGPARRVLPELARRLGVAEVHAARDYEPYARRRDDAVAEELAGQGQRLHLHKDQVIFEADELVGASGRPYRVFGPYRRAWLARLTAADLAPWPSAAGRLAPAPDGRLPELAELGFRPADPGLPPPPCSGTTSVPASGATTSSATTPPWQPPPASRPTCASAPCRSASWSATPAPTQARAPRPGWPS
ncbi:deoxyribodipyrimidine photo-lyase [Parasulfuritortus cantonensis]|uniref:deoxyribodipyrimidine photo-lyase n=1 Tax=Parasulfuritortus cantonensis TaxID=2528202 RepID=UPI0030B81E1D